VTLRVEREATSAVAAELLASLPVRDLTIEEPPIEEIIAAIFNAPAPTAFEPSPVGNDRCPTVQ
jgi:ABC-type uncharacterized transport system ATPase subunit